MRYYFNLEDGQGLVMDGVGKDFATDARAHSYAIEIGADIVADELKAGVAIIDMMFTITNSTGKIIMCVPVTATAGERIRVV